MYGRSALDISLSKTRESVFIYDLVYTPVLTPLILDAKNLNRKYLGGLDMLIAQARPSFTLFFGEAPKLEFDPKHLLLKHLNQ